MDTQMSNHQKVSNGAAAVVVVVSLGLEPMGFHPLFTKLEQVLSVYCNLRSDSKYPSAHDILRKEVSEGNPIYYSYRFHQRFISLE